MENIKTLTPTMKRVGELCSGDEFSPDDKASWMTVMDTTVIYPHSQAPIVLVISIGGKRWWGHLDEVVIVMVQS